MKRFIIEVPEPSDEIIGCGFDVVDENGRRSNGMAFDEVLGQLIALAHPGLDGKPQYRMQTDDEWEAEAEARAERRERARETS